MRQHQFSFEGFTPQRLDQFLAEVMPGMSRSYIKKLVAEGLVTVDGRVAKASRTLRGGEELVVSVPPAKPLEAGAEEIPLDILYEDGEIVVVNKPAGMVVHPAPGNESGTLVNALLAHCGDLSGVGGRLRPGIVHRLDVGTSGAIVVAKNDAAHRALAAQFNDRAVKKNYKAIVYGRVEPSSGSIDVAIGRDRRDRKKISANTDRGRDALTHYEVEQRWAEFSLLSVRLVTGRTHQVRVHLAHIKYPLVGDGLYGGSRWRGVGDPELRSKARNFGRPALHSHILAFAHPVSGKVLQFEAPMPTDILNFITELRSRA